MQKSQPKLISKHYSRLDTSSAAKNDTSLQKQLSIDKLDSAASGTIENGFPQMGLNSSILFISNTYEPGDNDKKPEDGYEGGIITRSTSVASRPIIIRPKT